MRDTTDDRPAERPVLSRVRRVTQEGFICLQQAARVFSFPRFVLALPIIERTSDSTADLRSTARTRAVAIG